MMQDNKNNHWLLEISQNENYWQERYFDELPTFIAHEYYRLWQMTCDQNVFCMVYQIKDVGEVLLKLPILCAAAYLKEVENDDSIAVKMIEKKLSISDWTTICSHLISKYNRQYRYAIPVCLRNILERVNWLCNNSKLVEGRNDYLGHGAMGFDDNAEYRSFSLSLMEGVSKYLDEIFNDYSQIVIKIGDHALKGRFFPDLSDVEVPPVLLLEGKEIPLSPFIVNSSAYGGLFFDYFRTGNTDLSAMGLNYITGGGRKPFVAPYYRELYQREYRNILNSKSEMANENVDGDTIGIELEKLLDSMNTTDNFIRPDYIIKWINDIHIDEHGSVCLLTMDRGMGKTSLSYALADKKISEMNDTFVAAYYCGSSQIQRDYILAINHALATGISERKTDSFVLLKRDALDRRQNMLESLEYFRKQHKLWDHKTKLMLIIDGLDELPQENQGLFDYIPAPENMPDNVYILLTSRNPVKEPLPEHVTKGLTEIRKNISDVMTVGADESSPNSYNNHTLLKEFVQKKVCLPSGKKPTEDEAESLIGLSGGIFLNLKLYAKLVESGMELHNLPALDSKELFSMYLGEIRKYYGDKLFDEAMTMLYAIITAQEPLTAHEIAWLSGEEHVTLKQIAFIRDFGALLKTVRTQEGTEYLNERGTLFKSANIRYIKYINEFFPQKEKELAEIFIDQLSSINFVEYKLKDEVYMLPDGLFYMATYLPKISEQIFPDLLISNVVILSNLITSNVHSYILERKNQLGVLWYNYCKVNKCYRYQFDFLYISFDSLLKIGDIQSAYAISQNSMNLVYDFYGHNQITSKMNYALSLYEIGRIESENKNIQNSKRYYCECIETIRKLISDGKNHNLRILAYAYMQLGIDTLLSDNNFLNNSKEAIYYFSNTISILENLRTNRNKQFEFDNDTLAKAYNNRGIAYSASKQFKKSLLDFKNSTDLRVKSHLNNQLENNELASVYASMGLTYWHMGNEYKYEALKYLDKCIIIRKELKAKKLLFDPIGLLGKPMLLKGLLLIGEFNNKQGAVSVFEEALNILGKERILSPTSVEYIKELKFQRLSIIFNDFDGHYKYNSKDLEDYERLCEERLPANYLWGGFFFSLDMVFER